MEREKDGEWVKRLNRGRRVRPSINMTSWFLKSEFSGSRWVRGDLNWHGFRTTDSISSFHISLAWSADGQLEEHMRTCTVPENETVMTPNWPVWWWMIAPTNCMDETSGPVWRIRCGNVHFEHENWWFMIFMLLDSAEASPFFALRHSCGNEAHMVRRFHGRIAVDLTPKQRRRSWLLLVCDPASLLDYPNRDSWSNSGGCCVTGILKKRDARKMMRFCGLGAKCDMTECALTSKMHRNSRKQL
jgi:hypothetical protein